MLSQGRLEVGLGAGWVAAEYEGLGITMDRPGVRIERLAEVIEVLKAHWAGEPLDVRGAHVRPAGRGRSSSRIRRSSSAAPPGC